MSTSKSVAGGKIARSPLHRVGLLWDEGALTHPGLNRFIKLVDSLMVTAGPRQTVLAEAARDLVGNDKRVEMLPSHPKTVRDMVRMLDHMQPDTVSLLCVGAPFQAEKWTVELESALLNSTLPGLVVIIPGPTGGPLTTVALTESALPFASLIRSGLARGLGDEVNAGASIPTLGGEAAASVITDQVGDVALVYSNHNYPQVRPTAAKAALSAADVVHARMTDVGLEATNRTQMSVQMRLHTGSPGGVIMEMFEIFLEPQSSVLLEGDALLSIGKLAAPVPEMRQWSHEAEVVYEGGERRIHQVEVRYLGDSLVPEESWQVLGEDTFGSVDSVVVGSVSTEIARAIGAEAHSVGRRLSGLAARENWQDALKRLVSNPADSAGSLQ